MSFQKKRSSKWTKDHSSDILAKTMAAFFPLSENMPEAKLKSLTAWAEEMLRD